MPKLDSILTTVNITFETVLKIGCVVETLLVFSGVIQTCPRSIALAALVECLVASQVAYMGVSLNGGTPKTPQNDHF